MLGVEIGKSWLASAKIARKAGQWQTAYSAMLQAQQSNSRFSFMESAKLVKTTGEPLRALQELENAMRLFGLMEDNRNVIDLTEDEEARKMKAKVPMGLLDSFLGLTVSQAQVLRARWMNEAERFEVNHILRVFQNATEMWPRFEVRLHSTPIVD
jgi:serine/threonine-protein kinase ATR